MRSKLRALAVFSLLTISRALAQDAAPPGENPSAQVDKLFRKMDTTVTPGCALSVMKDGKIIYKRGYGMADLDHNVPNTPTTIFHVASMSKQFTAARSSCWPRRENSRWTTRCASTSPNCRNSGFPSPSASCCITPAACATNGTCSAWRAGVIPSTSSPTKTSRGRLAPERPNFPPGSSTCTAIPASHCWGKSSSA